MSTRRIVLADERMKGEGGSTLTRKIKEDNRLKKRRYLSHIILNQVMINECIYIYDAVEPKPSVRLTCFDWVG